MHRYRESESRNRLRNSVCRLICERFNVYTRASLYVQAFVRFVDTLLADFDDVYFVTSHQAIEWMRQPRTIVEATSFQPWRRSCNPTNITRVCYYFAPFKLPSIVMSMSVCLSVHVRPNFANFFPDVACGSILLSRRCDRLYVLPVLRMTSFSYHGTDGHGVV